MTHAPRSEEELRDLVARAGADGTTLAIAGGGTRGIAVRGARLQMAGLAGITLYEPAEMVISARAGTPLALVERTLAEKGQMLPFDPMDHRRLLGTSGTPTIGAVAACNVSGSRRVSAGAARDHLIGVRFVNGRGEIIKSGGRVMKNVTGLDLVKLSAGAHGTLGALTEVTFKVLPVPETRLTLCLSGLAPEMALDAMAEAMATPFEVSAAAHLPAGQRGPAMTLMRLEGFEESCRYRFDRLASHLAAFGSAERIAGEEEAALWTAIRDVHSLADHRYSHVLRVHVRPSRTEAIAGMAQRNGLDLAIDWAGGLVWLGLLAPEGIETIKAEIARLGGHAMVVRGAGDAPFLAPAPALQGLGRRIKAAFDPQGIFNPGLFAGHM